MNLMLPMPARPDSALDLQGILIGLLAGLICSAIVHLAYSVLYEPKDQSAGVQRSFLIIGPAVTAIFLGIQFSLPLSLGLLGALSFIRFRTPIRDAEEVAYLLLLIACSIASATFNFVLAFTLLTFVIAVQLIYKKLLLRQPNVSRQGSIVVTLDTQHADRSEAVLELLKQALGSVKLSGVASTPDSTNLHYQYRRNRNGSPASIAAELRQKIPGLLNVNLLAST